MMRVYYYKDMTPRVRARRSFFLTKGDYTTMARAENVQALLRRLENTRYKPYIAPLLLEEFSVDKAEHALMTAQKIEISFLLRQLNMEKAIRVFKLLERSMELESIADTMRVIIMGGKWEDAAMTVMPYGSLDSTSCRTLVEGKNIKRLLQMIKEQDLARKLEGIMQEAVDEHLQALRVEAAIKIYSHLQVWEKVKELQGDDKSAARVLGTLHDSYNIMTVLRGKKLGLKPNEIETQTLPLYYKLKNDEVKKAAATLALKETLKFFTSTWYVHVLAPMLSVYESNEDLFSIQLVLRRFHASECNRVLMLPYFHLGEGLAYLYVKLYEVKDILSILTAKHFSISPDKIEENLTLHQVPYPL